MDWSTIQARLQRWGQEKNEIIAIYLFGSRAEGRASPDSDVDLALLAQPNTPVPLLWRCEDQWAGELTRLLTLQCMADVFVLNLAPLEVRFQTITKGKMLWACNQTVVADFESYTRRQYWDFYPYQQRYRQNLKLRIKERWDATRHNQYRAALEQTRAVHRRVKAAARANA